MNVFELESIIDPISQFKLSPHDQLSWKYDAIQNPNKMLPLALEKSKTIIN